MNNTTKKPSPIAKYEIARTNLILMIVLTLINVIFAVIGLDYMMLFSATVPYLFATIGTIEEFSAFLVPGLVLALIGIGMYFLCWLLSKKHYAWMIVALVLFSFDTLAMMGMYLFAGDFSGIIDVIIHIWVLYYLIIGVINGHKKNNLTEQDIQSTLNGDDAAEPVLNSEGNIESAYDPTVSTFDTPILRKADTAVKARILLEVEAEGHKICYRRVKRVNELVIDGCVYADVEALVEVAHVLSARVGGKLIQAGFDGAANSYIKIDGQQIAKKLRLW